MMVIVEHQERNKYDKAMHADNVLCMKERRVDLNHVIEASLKPFTYGCMELHV